MNLIQFTNMVVIYVDLYPYAYTGKVRAKYFPLLVFKQSDTNSDLRKLKILK